MASPTTRTSLPGVFAAGTGAAAALDAERYLASRGTAETEPETVAVPA